MKHLIVLSLLLTGCSAATPEPVDHSQMDHGHEHHHHHHEALEVTGDVPTVDLTIHKDPKSGYNLHIDVTNFRFAPENASGDHVEGEGHAHLFINDEKITRLYEPWYYLGTELPSGTHEVRVDLNSNNHMQLQKDGKPIEDTETLTIE